MPKNIVIIDDDKADAPPVAPGDLIGSEAALSFERVPPPPDLLLHAAELPSPKKPNILRGAGRASVVQTPPRGGGATPAPGAAPRIVAVSTAPDGNQSQQQHVMSPGPRSAPAHLRVQLRPVRTLRVAMQVPVVMTSLGQKISTVAVQQPPGAGGVAGHAAILSGPAAAGGGQQQKVVIQTIPAMVPATAENGEKITVQLAKIITIPAHQLAQCQLTGSPGAAKPGATATAPPGLSLLGAPLTVRALAPVGVAPGTQVMRLSVPTATQPQTVVVSQPGGGGGVVTVTAGGRTLLTTPRIISGVLSGSELLIGGGGAAAAQQQLGQSDGEGKPESDGVKTEEPEC
ncbi:unnamed protein product [Menidia menidia]|uniref:(Atlantic silverside) hypothetical protein n=1 Tax=Menidia menidia TaxID=238744 RepID=A0A8S4B783_9TELE|nr:unnamed protein product [Menidia menidia]